MGAELLGNLLILGAGGHGSVVADTASAMRRFGKIAFLDDKRNDSLIAGRFPIIGTFSEAEDYLGEYNLAFVAVGDNRLRMQLILSMQKNGFLIPNIVHPQSYLGVDVKCEQGTAIFACAVVNVGSRIGAGVIINTGATIDHNCHIGNGVHISPGAHLAGDVIVGDLSWMGTGSIVIPGISIGSESMVGAGAVVIRSVMDKETVVGNPARVLKK